MIDSFCVLSLEKALIFIKFYDLKLYLLYSLSFSFLKLKCQMRIEMV